MSELLTRMEASGLGTWVRESPSIWAYPTILTLHSIGLAIVVGASVVIDLQLLGRARGLKRTDLAALFPVIWWAFAVNALTGVMLFIADATRKSAQPIFYIKLGCIAVALIVMWRTRLLTASNPPLRSGLAAPVPSAQHRTLALLSLVLWIGAIVAGRLMAYL